MRWQSGHERRQLISSPGSAIGNGGITTISRQQAWYIVAILTLLYVVSFVDRVIASLMMTSISEEFGITDTQLGFVVGTGFAIVYSLCSFPLAQLIDSRERRRIVVAGALLWSTATAISAFSSNVYEFAVLRAGVAIGEAVLMPAAVSLMADMFPPERRAAPIAVFGGMGAVMVGGSWILGASALDVASLVAPGTSIAPWRVTLMIVGVPGIAIALLFLLTVREPARAQSSSSDTVTDTSVASLFAFLAKTWTVFLPLFVGIALFATYTFGVVTWLPTVIVRAHSLSYQAAGYMAGAACGTTMTVGAFLWPFLASRLDRRWPARGPMIALLISGLLAAPPMVVASTSSSLAVLVGGSAWSMGCLISLSVLPPQTIQLLGPPRMQARLMAILILATSMIGYSFGATMIPILGGLWEGADVPIAYGMASLGLLGGVVGSIFFSISVRQAGKLVRSGVLAHGPGGR